jgi:hypothetical protein
VHSVGLRIPGELITSFQYQAPDAGAAEGECGTQADRPRANDQDFWIVAHFLRLLIEMPELKELRADHRPASASATGANCSIMGSLTVI